MSIPDVLARLRAATGPAHERLEADVDIFAAIATHEGRRRLVRRFHSLHSGAEAALSPWLDGIPDLEFSARRRLDRLNADLLALDAEPDPADGQSPPASLAEALGRLYVLEGSTLGGQVIRKRVIGGGGSMEGLSFLDPYGPETGRRWQAFVRVLERECPDAPRIEAAVTGALAGFEAASQGLCAREIAA